MHRILIIVLLSVMILVLSSEAFAEDSPFELVKGWLDANNIVYMTTEKNEIAIGIKGENIPGVNVVIGFSEEFIHFMVPVGEIPPDAGADYYAGLIDLTGSIPMIKPFIDKESYFYLVIDFPLGGFSEEEVMTDIALLVKFTDINNKELYPWEEEN